MVRSAARMIQRGLAVSVGLRDGAGRSRGRVPPIAWVMLAACLAPACAFDFDAAFSEQSVDAGSVDGASTGGKGGAGVEGGAGAGGETSAGGAGGHDAAISDVAVVDVAVGDVALVDVSLGDGAVEDATDGAAQEAEAAAPVVSPVKQVLHGTTQLIAFETKAEVLIPAVDPGRSFLVFGTRFENGTPTDSMVTGNLTSPTKLVFQRPSKAFPAPLRVDISWHVAEFVEGVSVQRGSVPVGASATVQLGVPVDRSKSFPIVTFRNSGSYYGQNDFLRVDLVSDLQLSLSLDSPADDGVAEWQVVTFVGCQVQHGSYGLAVEATSAALDVAGADPARTWLLHSYSYSGNGTTVPSQHEFVRGTVESPGKLAFAREGATGSIDAAWHAVTFQNGTVVKPGLAVLDSTQATVASAPLGMDLDRSFALASGMWERSGTTPFTGPKPGLASFTFDWTAPSVVSLARGSTGAPATVAWSAIEFAR